MMRRLSGGQDFDSRTNIIVTNAKLQGLAMMVGSNALSCRRATTVARMTSKRAYREGGRRRVRQVRWLDSCLV